MRKEKWEELNDYIKELQTIKIVKKENQPTRFLSAEAYQVTLQNGESIIREKIVKGRSDNPHPGASIILPITTEGNVLLVVQPRVFTRSTVGVEIPAGYIDQNEHPLKAAMRELEEETAHLSEQWYQLGNGWYQDDGCSDSYNYSFLAMNCTKTGVLHRDKDEFMKIFECTIKEAYELLDKGYIAGSGGAITLERAKQYIRRR
ncbi:MAG: NUDIX hydrolase [Bacilli bacterium]|nr:NUDIX hydrolase [Bacilli bacterium]